MLFLLRACALSVTSALFVFAWENVFSTSKSFHRRLHAFCCISTYIYVGFFSFCKNTKISTYPKRDTHVAISKSATQKNYNKYCNTKTHMLHMWFLNFCNFAKINLRRILDETLKYFAYVCTYFRISVKIITQRVLEFSRQNTFNGIFT